MPVGSRDRPPRREQAVRPGSFTGNGGREAGLRCPVIRILLVGDGESLEAALERVGASRLVEVVAVLTAAAALDPGMAAGDAALVVAPWPAAAEWLPSAPAGSPLGGALPILLVGGEPPRARLLVETPAASLPAAIHPASAGPLVGLAAELAALRTENRDLKEALEARKAIERAKGILMEQEGITEGEAFTRIQRLSMAKRRSMKEIAEAIILSREVTGG